MIPHPIFWGNSLPKNYGKQFFNPSTLCCEESCNYSFQKDFDQRFSLQFLHHLDGNDDEHDNLGYYWGDKNDKDLLSRGREAWNGDKYRCERTHCIGKAGIVTDGLLTRLAELEVLHNWWGKVGCSLICNWNLADFKGGLDKRPNVNHVSFFRLTLCRGKTNKTCHWLILCHCNWRLKYSQIDWLESGERISPEYLWSWP